MSAIAELVTLLISTGIPPETLSAAIDLAQRHGVEQVEIHRNSTGIPPETAADKRKAWDRERKRKIAETKKPPLILTSCSTESKKLTEVESKKERRAREKKRLGPLPESWQPPDIAYALASECGTTVPYVEAIFRDYLKSSGKLYADHDAAFCNFVRNQRKFNGQNHGKTSDNPKSGSLIAALDRALERSIAEDAALAAPAHPLLGFSR